MANNIKIDCNQIIKDLHKVALENVKKKTKDIDIQNGLANDAKLSIKITSTSEIKKSDAKKAAVEYFKSFAGEDVAKQIKDNDIEEGESKTSYSLKLTDDTTIASEPSDDDKDVEDSNNISTKKKKFSIFSDLADAGKTLLKVARSIRIVTRQGGSYPVGKWLFGTTHDVGEAKEKLKEQFDKEFPNNMIDYKVFSSETVYNILVSKKKAIDPKEEVCKKLRESKYTFCGYVYENDPNYDSIDKEALKHFFKKALHFNPSVIHLILDYNTSYKNKNKNAGDLDKKKLEKHSDIIQKKIELTKKFDADKKKIEKSGSKDATEQLEKLTNSIKTEYKNFLNAKYDERVKKYEKSSDFDKDEDLKQFKQILSDELKDLENRMTNGNSDNKDDLPDLYVVPLTSKNIFNKLRHSFDNSGESSDKGGSK